MRRARLTAILSLTLLLSGCAGSMNPRLCIDTTLLPKLPFVRYADPSPDAPTQRCGGFALGVTLGDRGAEPPPTASAPSGSGLQAEVWR